MPDSPFTSPFARAAAFYDEFRPTYAPEAIGYVIGASGVGFSPEGLGDDRLAFEGHLVEALFALRLDGVFEENLETAVIISRKT